MKITSAIKRYRQSFAALQDGDCWIGINFRQALETITAEQAAKLAASDCNSIWHLVVHVNYWRTTVINRLNGSLLTPSFPDFHLPEPLSEHNWKQTREEFDECYHRLQKTLLQIQETQLDQPTCHPGQTYDQLIGGCLQHDAYHLGQIVLISKLLKET